MKRIKLFLIAVFLLFTSCVSMNTTENAPTAVVVDETNPTAIISEPTSTIVSSPTTQPTTIPTLTVTPDIVTLRTQGVDEPWITATLGTKIPPPWYSKRILFSPNNKLLVSSYSNKISLWEVGSYNKLNEFVVLNERYGVERFAFSSDSRLLAATVTYYDDPKSHLFVWDITSMELKLSVDLDVAILEKDLDYPYQYPATAIAFIPNSTIFVTANGNSIQIIDVDDAAEPITIDLGEDMYASNISFPGDGRFIYVFMEWWKDNGLRLYPRYQTKYVVQIWDTNGHFLWRTLNFPELGWGDEPKHLQGSYLVTSNPEKGTNEIMNLENEEIQKLPYRLGWSYITTDKKYILFSRHEGTYPNRERVIEFWTTDSWKMLYTFYPDYYKDTDGYQSGSYPGELAISNDNSLLALAHAGQIIIYDIRILTTP